MTDHQNCSAANVDLLALSDRLRHAAVTAQNDDLSEPGSEKRQRHVARFEIMLEASEALQDMAAKQSRVGAKTAGHFEALQAALLTWFNTLPGESLGKEHWQRLVEILKSTPVAAQPPAAPVEAPGHEDLMVSPESIDAYMEANPLPEPAATVETACDTVKHMWGQVEKARADGTFSSPHQSCSAGRETEPPEGQLAGRDCPGVLESDPALFNILNNALGTMHYHRLMSALNWNGYIITREPQEAWQPAETRPDSRYENVTYLIANEKGQVAPFINGIIHNNVGTSWDWDYGESVVAWMPMPTYSVTRPQSQSDNSTQEK